MADDSNIRDVRMRGFAARALVEDVQRWVDSHSAPLSAESAPLDAAGQRVLASDVVSPLDVPEFDRAAMDGYAVHADETTGASDYQPVVLQIAGRAAPGRPWGGRVARRQAVEVMTGAPLPRGADAVVPAEYATLRGESVELTSAVTPGKHVSMQGEDIRVGAVIASAGRRLRPQDLGVIASVGSPSVEVVRRPRVRLVLTGSELTAPGSERPPCGIFDANSFVLRGLVARDGGLIESVQFPGDDETALRTALAAPDADVVLVSGGSSVGREDRAPGQLRELGELAFHGVAMRPSSPAGAGRIGSVLVFLLPGNPVSCLCAYDFFAGRAVRGLGGLPHDWPYLRTTCRLERRIVSQVGRLDYCRVRVTDQGIAAPIAISGAAVLSSTTRADGFVVVPANSEGYAEGAEVVVWRY